MNRYFQAGAIALVFVMSLTTSALAAVAVSPDDGSWLDLLKPLLSALTDGKPALAAALALVFIAAMIKRYGAKQWSFLGTDVGSALIVLVGSFGGATATALSGGATVSLALLWTAIKVAASAAGLYSLAKPLLLALQKKLPTWAQPALLLVMWIFEKPDPVVTAVKAGNDAVAAHPSGGISDLFGDVEEIK